MFSQGALPRKFANFKMQNDECHNEDTLTLKIDHDDHALLSSPLFHHPQTFGRQHRNHQQCLCQGGHWPMI
jgi:hypothetical protein